MAGRWPAGAGIDRTPPWVAAFGTQAAAAWLVFRGDARDGEYDVPAFAAFMTQLGLTAAWLLLFFRVRRPAFALAEMCLLWFAVAMTVREFARKHRVAAALLLPYLGWVTYAGAVNARVWWRTR
jgi:tryptophan-rich sensory protein